MARMQAPRALTPHDRTGWPWGFEVYRRLVQGSVDAGCLAFGESVWYRARHHAVSAIHRHLLYGARIDRVALGAIWAAAWVRAGGDDAPDLGGYPWLRSYAADVPCVRHGRRLLAVRPLWPGAGVGAELQEGPDAVVLSRDGVLEAFEFSAALPLADDVAAVQARAAEDRFRLRQACDSLPCYNSCRIRVIVCDLQTGEEVDAALLGAEAAQARLGCKQGVPG